MTITAVIIKTPDRKNGIGDVNDVMPGSYGLGFLVILNKSRELRFGLRLSELIFGPGWGQSSYSLVGALRVVGSDGTVSIVRIVSLSPRVEKPKLKEGNKSFVPEPRESSVFRVFRIPMRIKILWTLRKFYEHMYISHIRIRIMAMLHKSSIHFDLEW